MALPSRALTTVVCDSDRWQAQALAQLLEEHGFEVLGTAENAVEAINLTAGSNANAVVITHEHLGLSGLEATPDLRALPQAPEVVLLSIEGEGTDAARAAGAFAVVARGDLEHLELVIDDLAHLLRTGERRGERGDRRTGADRRVTQDWSKVFTERRSGDDRRKGDRRQPD